MRRKTPARESGVLLLHGGRAKDRQVSGELLSFCCSVLMVSSLSLRPCASAGFFEKVKLWPEGLFLGLRVEMGKTWVKLREHGPIELSMGWTELAPASG